MYKQNISLRFYTELKKIKLELVSIYFELCGVYTKFINSAIYFKLSIYFDKLLNGLTKFSIWKKEHPWIYRLCKISGKWGFRMSGFGIILDIGQYAFIIFKHHEKVEFAMNYIINMEAPTAKKVVIGTAVVVGTGVAIYVINNQIEYYKNDVRFQKNNFDKLVIEHANLKIRLKELEFAHEYGEANERLANKFLIENPELTRDLTKEAAKASPLQIIVQHLKDKLTEVSSLKSKILGLEQENKVLDLKFKKAVIVGYDAQVDCVRARAALAGERETLYSERIGYIEGLKEEFGEENVPDILKAKLTSFNEIKNSSKLKKEELLEVLKKYDNS